MNPDVLSRREEMTKFFLLGLEIFFRVRAGGHFARHALDNFNASALQGLDLFRVIGKQSNLAHT